MSLLHMGLLRDLLNSVSSARAQSSGKDGENWKSSTKPTESMIPGPRNSSLQ